MDARHLRSALSDARVLLRVPLAAGLTRDSGLRGTLRLLREFAHGRRDLYMLVGTYAAQRPHAVAVADEHTSRTWSELDTEVRRVSSELRWMGVRAGDRVALVCGNRVEWFAAMAACSQLGAVCVPLSPGSPGPEIARRLDAARAVAAIVEARHAETAVSSLGAARVIALDAPDAACGAILWSDVLALSPARRQRHRSRGADAPDVMLFTSGTTGRSRGARIRTSAVGLPTAMRLIEGFGIDRDTVLFTPCPLYHGAPLLLTGLTLVAGGRIAVAPRLDAASAPELFARLGVTHVFMVPTLLERIAALPPDALAALRSGPLRVVISGGAALRTPTKRALARALGPVLRDFYGATELGVVSIAGPDDLDRHPASVGRPLPGVRLRLLDDALQPVGPGEAGELWVSGDALSDGYEGVEDATPEALRGWATAGDVARLDDEGFLYIVDRKKDVIITGGVNVFPAEVEDVLLAHPAVESCAVAGVPDEAWGEAVHAFVVLASGCAVGAEELVEHCRALVAPALVPKVVHFREALPLGSTGKVLRRALRAQVAAPVAG